MDTRSKMLQFRKDHHLSIRDISDRIYVSSDLIGMVEKGEVTHPLIVQKLASAYGLSNLEAEQLMPKNHRPHDPEYDPLKYVVSPPTQISYKTVRTVYDDYISDKANMNGKGQY